VENDHEKKFIIKFTRQSKKIFDVRIVLANDRQSASLRIVWFGRHSVRNFMLKREDRRNSAELEQVVLAVHGA